MLAKAGVTGPKLRARRAGEACSKDYAAKPNVDGAREAQVPETDAGGFPTFCGGIVGVPASAADRYKFGARDVAMRLIANSLASWGNLGRPVIDETGLAGTYDFILEFTPERLADSAADSGGLSFVDALRVQLGLKLVAQKAPVEFLVVDRVERPSEN